MTRFVDSISSLWRACRTECANVALVERKLGPGEKSAAEVLSSCVRHAFDAGLQAGLESPNADNPYFANTPEHSAWARGLNEGVARSARGAGAAALFEPEVHVIDFANTIPDVKSLEPREVAA